MPIRHLPNCALRSRKPKACWWAEGKSKQLGKTRPQDKPSLTIWLRLIKIQLEETQILWKPENLETIVTDFKIEKMLHYIE